MFKRLKNVFLEYAKSKSTVYPWIKKFKTEEPSLSDKLHSGKPNLTVNDENILVVENLAMEVKQIIKQITILEASVSSLLDWGQACSVQVFQCDPFWCEKCL